MFDILRFVFPSTYWTDNSLLPGIRLGRDRFFAGGEIPSVRICECYAAAAVVLTPHQEATDEQSNCRPTR